MPTIAKEYVVLFNAITDAITSLDNLEKKLRFAQQCAEEIYIERFDTPNDKEKSDIT